MVRNASVHSVFCVALIACAHRPKASAAQCERAVDRYGDLALSEDPRAPKMSTEQRARLRGAIALGISAEPDVRRVKTRCQADLTEDAYRCAMAAQTTAAWRGCIERIE